MEKDKSYIVYMHVNKLNRKVYVGITHFSNPKIRWGKEGKSYHCSRKFFNAIKKYGWDNFHHTVLCKTSKERAKLLEVTLIALYKRKNMSYNIANGGEGADSVSEETRRTLSRVLKGKKRKKESTERTVQTRKSLDNYDRNPYWLWSRDISGSNNPMYGRKHTEEALRKKYKSVLQYDKQGNLIAEYEAVKFAAKAINMSCTHVVAALRGRSKTAGGYIWKYKDNGQINTLSSTATTIQEEN